MQNAPLAIWAKTMLDVSDLCCVRGEKPLFSGLGFRLEGGELLYLHGRNGSGKTSLLRILSGLLPAAGGEVRWRGESVERLGEDYRRELCFLGHHNAIKEELTPLENLQLARRLGDEPPDEEAALSALARLGLAGREDLPCRYLSQGQKRRVALSRLVNDRRALWLLDEPFVALDTAAVELVATLIAMHVQLGGLAVLTTHQSVDIAVGTIRKLELGAC